MEGDFAHWPDPSPDLGRSLGLVQDPLSELIEAETKPRFVAVAVSAGLDRPCSLDGGRAGIGPGHGEGDDDQQGVELGGLRETGIFHVQAPGLAVAEQAFDLPALPVSLEGLIRGAIGGDDQKLAVTEPLGGEGERCSQAVRHGVKTRGPFLQPFDALAPSQQALELEAAPVIETNKAVLFHPDGEHDVVLQQKLYPLAADELAVGKQPGDRV